MTAPTPPSLTLLIVTWNSWGDLHRCLESIRRNAAGADREVLVFDNGSADGTVDKVRQQYPEVRLETSPVNLGLPPALNRGLRAARGEFVMILDVDTEVRPGTVERLLSFMREHPEVSVVAPRIHAPDGTIEMTARNLPSAMNGLFGRQSLLTRWFPGNPFSRRYLALERLGSVEPFRVEQVSAACMFLRRSLLDEVGPWDEKYRCYWVDTDWCAQLRTAGKVVYCVPDVSIVHYENNKSFRKKKPWRIVDFHTGAYRIYRKHYTFGALDPRALAAAVLLAVRAVVMLVLNELKSEPKSASPTPQRPA